MKTVYSFTLFSLFIALFSNAIPVKEVKSESRNVPQERASLANTRENVARNKLCPECTRIYPGDINFCSVDGKQLIDFKEEDLICPTCNEKASPEEKFCKNDGTQLVLKSSIDKKVSRPDKKVEINIPADAPPEERQRPLCIIFWKETDCVKS